jgi:predicted nucleic acid-binding protein
MNYIDSNIFILALLNTDEEGGKARKIISRISSGEKAVTSYLTLDEVMWKVKKFRSQKDAVNAAETMISTPNLLFITVDDEVMSKAISAMKEINLDPRDAIHLGSMRKAGVMQIVSLDSHFDHIPQIKRIII